MHSRWGRVVNVAGVVLLACAPAAVGQCNAYRTNVPDFDQRRTDGGLFNPGLPGNGGWYCVPTASINWIAYIANHGIPGIMGNPPGPNNWQALNLYPLVTLDIAEMGSLMGTGASSGTGGGGWVDGLQAYLDDHAPGLFEVTGMFAWESYAPRPEELYLVFGSGGLVSFSYSPYNVNNGVYTRAGGHIVTMQHIYNACTDNPLLGYKDPWTASDESMTAQSPFASVATDLTAVTANFRYPNQSGSHSRTMWRMNDLPNNSFVDGYVTIWPPEALTADPVLGVLMVLRRPVLINIPGAPQQINMPTGSGPIRQLEPHPRRTSFTVLTGPPAVGGPGGLWKVNRATGEVVPARSIPSPGPIASGRHGDLFITEAGLIKRLDLECDPPCVTGQATPPVVPDVLFYNDAADELVGVNIADRRLIRMPGSLVAPPGGFFNALLPIGVIISGEASVAVHPLTGAVWLTSTGSPLIYRLGVDGVGRLFVAESFTPPGPLPIRGLSFDTRGHMFFVTGDGSVREMRRVNEVWTLVQGGAWDGVTVGPFFKPFRSRTNFMPAIMLDPGAQNLNPPPQNLNPPTPDCWADINRDGVVDSSDISAYITLWLTDIRFGGMRSDHNLDGVINSTDISSFVTAWLAAVTGGCNP